MRQVELRVG